jgi:hypothetical protein
MLPQQPNPPTQHRIHGDVMSAFSRQVAVALLLASATRTKVRGNKSGSYKQGVNKSCYYTSKVACDCQQGWAGGLPERTLYLQSSE